ncbi:MAG: hypothetical protein ACJ8CR_23775 [Roseiflexaceae bacterium]
MIPHSTDASTASSDSAAGTPRPITRRLFSRGLLVGLPTAVAAALFSQAPEVAEAGVDSDWTLAGNALPNATSFMGSTNAQPVSFRTNNLTRMTITTAGDVGIGMAAPPARLGVAGSGIGIFGYHAAGVGTAPGVRGDTASTGADAVGVLGLVRSTTPGSASVGVRGINNGTGASGIGVWGSQNGSGYGVFGSTPNGIGVYGNSSTSTGVFGKSTAGHGVWGESATGSGVVGVSKGAWIGVYGESAQYEGVRGVSHHKDHGGVVGINDRGGIAVYGTAYYGIGVYGNTWPLNSGYAGWFNGRVHVNGILSKAAGAFKIDHPLAPETKYLSHSFVESPDMLNIYNGNVTLDERGAAVVKLPAWFEALNQDFRYQLTAIGAPGPNLYIAEKIKGNRFKIAGGVAGMEVSWQVTGVRHDAYAQAHRIPLEEDKPAAERGTYLHPLEHGQPATKALDYAAHQALPADMVNHGADLPAHQALPAVGEIDQVEIPSQAP